MNKHSQFTIAEQIQRPGGEPLDGLTRLPVFEAIDVQIQRLFVEKNHLIRLIGVAQPGKRRDVVGVVFNIYDADAECAVVFD
jgi:hypothetical protein